MHYFSGLSLLALVAFMFLFGSIQCNNWEPCPVNWIAYNDEKCFKIIDDTLRTFDEAKDACSADEHIATLPVIRSAEEQQFLSNYLFKTEQKLENFWIGAKYSSRNASFLWIDNSPLNYTNWDAGQNPQNQANYCVHMQADERVAGKWKGGRCGKKNAVVCQRMQFWSHELLQKTFLNSRKQLKEAIDTIHNLTQRLSIQKSSFENVNQRIEELKQNFDDSNVKMNEQKQSLDSANLKIDELTQKQIPIGFVYTQLLKQKEPSELWPGTTWDDVSLMYANIFFRVEGSSTATFGRIQEDNAPRVAGVHHEQGCEPYRWEIATVVGGNSMPIQTGPWDNSGGKQCIVLTTSGGEVRPRNMAVRVWKRSG